MEFDLMKIRNLFQGRFRLVYVSLEGNKEILQEGNNLFYLQRKADDKAYSKHFQETIVGKFIVEETNTGHQIYQGN